MWKVNIGPFSPESPECNLKGQTCVSLCVFVHVCVFFVSPSTGATCGCTPGNNANQACNNGENGVPCSGNGECVCGQCRCTQLVIIELLPWQQWCLSVCLSHCRFLPSCRLQMNFIQEKPVNVVTSIVQLTNQEKGVVVRREGGRRREKLCGLDTSWLSVAPQVLRVTPTLSLLTGKGRCGCDGKCACIISLISNKIYTGELCDCSPDTFNCETSSGGSQVWESTRSPASHMMFTWPVAVLIGVIIITLLYVHFPLKQENNNHGVYS